MNGAHLEPSTVTAALTAIDAAVKATADAWRGHRATVDAKEAGIGSGPLAAAFRSVYLPAPATLGADRALSAVPAVVKAGQDGVADYVAADRRSAAALPR